MTTRDFGVEMRYQPALAKALNRLVLQGELQKIAKGKYYIPKKTIFGNLKPADSELVKDFLEQNRVFENLSFRGNVIAFLKACVLYVANGCKWEPEIDEFIRWSESYDLWCKMIFFGASIAKANEVGEKSSKRGPTNLLQLLPDTFTYTQAEMVRLQNDFGKKGTAMMLRNWVNRHYIEKIPPKGANTDGADAGI